MSAGSGAGAAGIGAGGTGTTPVAGLVATGVSVEGPAGTIVHPLDLTVPPGRMLAIIGESGSGKTMTARALTGLLPRGTRASGTAEIIGAPGEGPGGTRTSWDLGDPSEAQWARVRGRQAVLLLQDPFTSLSPVIRCGEQIAATIRTRLRAGGRAAAGKAALDAEVARRYPSELSGGQRQRVAIAAALAAEPRLLIADEPTTALDASTQGEVLDLLRELQRTHRMSLILISHDLGVVAGRADEVCVMRAGEVVERGDARRVLSGPQHPYTRALLEANPTIAEAAEEPGEGTSPSHGTSAGQSPDAVEAPGPEPGSAPVLEVRGISKSFGRVQALHDASVEVRAGEIVAVVGESGSGKSTFARCVAGLETPEAGIVRLDGRELPKGRRGRSPSEIQIVFQDPYSTLNPSFTVEQALAEALRAAGTSAGAAAVAELLALVDLDPALAKRRPAQLSGGQRQRVSIARALAPRPQLLICDESVSALDVSVQAQILALLARLRDELGLAMLFITHDLGVVARIADRAIVLQGGRIVESGATAQVLREPQHEYTRMLVAAAERESARRVHPGEGAEEPGAEGSSRDGSAGHTGDIADTDHTEAAP